MKLKYCLILTAVLIILFSLGSVAASDNATSEDIPLTADDSDDAGLDDGNQDIIDQDSSSFENTDLSVNIDLKNSHKGDNHYRVGTNVQLIVTVKVTGGVAVNTKVQETLSEGLGYVSHKTTMGKFDPATGIWDIGDLTSKDIAVLKITAKLLKDGPSFVIVSATTDSNDINSQNNIQTRIFKVEKEPDKPEATVTTSDKNGATHKNHYASSARSSVVRVNVEDYENNSDSKDGSLNKHVAAMKTYDYTRVPVGIFVLFLIIFGAVVAYDKARSK